MIVVLYIYIYITTCLIIHGLLSIVVGTACFFRPSNLRSTLMDTSVEGNSLGPFHQGNMAGKSTNEMWVSPSSPCLPEENHRVDKLSIVKK